LVFRAGRLLANIARAAGRDHDDASRRSWSEVVTLIQEFAPLRRKLILRNERFIAEIWPRVGGAVARLDYLGENGAPIPLLRRAIAKESYQPTDLACWPLLPFSNRIKEARFVFDGKEHRLPPDPAASPHALHGVGWRSAWRIVAIKQDKCMIALDHAADENWPFSLGAWQRFALNEDGLTILTTIANRGETSMPYGLGQHPYIARPPGTRLFARVDGVWLTDAAVIPTERAPIPPEWDLREGCILDNVSLDNCFDGLKGDVRVAWPDGGELAISGSDNLRFLIIYNPPRENFVCVELVSHMPDAFNRAAREDEDTGFAVLRPLETAVSRHRFVYRPPGG
jgi:aldose 1-epimerase